MNFTKSLILWYSVNKRYLPWRDTRSPYSIWLSEIIMQQTRIMQGLPYYEAFVNKFPTVFDLANTKEETVLKLWQGLGYYSRARNLHHTAKYVATELGGEFPKTYSELLKLKGVGDYTASAIASICFNEPTAVVDGNVYRVLSRYFGIETPINSAKGIKDFKQLAQSLLPDGNVGDYNQAIMEFGATQCKPGPPDCTICPLNTSCVAFERKNIADLPVKINKVKIKKKHFNFLVLVSDDKKTVLHKRTGNGIWRNLYQFPLVETKEALLIKDFKKNQKIKEILNKREFTFSLYNQKEIIHKLSHQHLHTKFWIVNVAELAEKAIKISEIETLPVPVIISKFIDKFNF